MMPKMNQLRYQVLIRDAKTGCFQISDKTPQGGETLSNAMGQYGTYAGLYGQVNVALITIIPVIVRSTAELTGIFDDIDSPIEPEPTVYGV